MFGCSGCTSRWGGLMAAHCGACHRTFSTVQNFDRHRRGPSNQRVCADPAAVGLVLGARGSWIRADGAPNDLRI